jgi:hypothetical protein
MGAGKWRDEYADALRGAGRVVILPDDDEEGRAHAAQVAASVAGVVADVRVVDLWNGGETKRDMSDWLSQATTDEERAQARTVLAEMAKQTPRWRPPTSESDDEPDSTWTACDLVALAADPPAPPAIGGLLYPGKAHVISGEAETGKSLSLLAIAADELLADHGVVWVDTDEMGPGPVLEVLRGFGVDDDRISRLFFYLRPEEAFTAEAYECLAALIAAHSVRLVVFDAFNATLSLHGLDPCSTVEVQRFLHQVVNPLARRGVAVALLDHVVKKAEERGRYAYGSERKQTGVQVHIGMKAIEPFGRGRRGKSKLTVHKDRPGFLERPSPGLFVLNSDAESGRLSWRIEADHSAGDEGEFRPTNLMEKISRHLEISGKPKSRNAIEQAVPGKTDWKRVAIDRLLAEGFAEEVPGDRGARLVKVVRVFREMDEWDEL